MGVIPQNLINAKLDNYAADQVWRILKESKTAIAHYTKATSEVPSGYINIKGDEALLKPEFHLFAGAPGSGKTTLGQNLAASYNAAPQTEAQKHGIAAFDFDEILKQMQMYRESAGADEQSRIDAYHTLRNASLYVSDSVVNAMLAGRRNIMYSIASSDGGAVKLAEGAQKAGYKVVVHVCEAPQHICEQAVADRFAQGDRYTDPRDVAEKPGKARANYIPLLAMADCGHLYYRESVDAGLEEVALFSGHLMRPNSQDENSTGYRKFVQSAGMNYDTFIQDIRFKAGLDRPTLKPDNDLIFDSPPEYKKRGW